MFIVVFGNDQYHQYNIREILSESFNSIVSEEHAFQGIRYCFPVVTEEDKYYFDPKDSEWTFHINEEQVQGKTLLKSGDYINISYQDISLGILVIEYKKCSISSTIYELGRKSSYLVGRSENSAIVLNVSESVSRKHAIITTDEDGNGFVEDISNKAGVYINGTKRINHRLTNGDHIFIMGTTMVFYKGILIIPSNIHVNGLPLKNVPDKCLPNENNNMLYVQTPRIKKHWIWVPLRLIILLHYKNK